MASKATGQKELTNTAVSKACLTEAVVREKWAVDLLPAEGRPKFYGKK
jgi:hypothetical protein